MICVSIAEHGFQGCLKALNGIRFAEVRLDKMPLTDKEIKKVFSLPKELIATCRIGKFGEAKRLRVLGKAIGAGASFVDVELESSKRFKQKILKKARENGCRVIISFHDFEKTPSRKALLKTIERCFDSGADIAKIACKVNHEKDNARLLGLLDSQKKIVVVGMGNKGKLTRIIAPILGGVFSFASTSTAKQTALGQISAEKMKKIMGAIKNA